MSGPLAHVLDDGTLLLHMELTQGIHSNSHRSCYTFEAGSCSCSCKCRDSTKILQRSYANWQQRPSSNLETCWQVRMPSYAIADAAVELRYAACQVVSQAHAPASARADVPYHTQLQMDSWSCTQQQLAWCTYCTSLFCCATDTMIDSAHVVLSRTHLEWVGPDHTYGACRPCAVQVQPQGQAVSWTPHLMPQWQCCLPPVCGCWRLSCTTHRQTLSHEGSAYSRHFAR